MRPSQYLIMYSCPNFKITSYVNNKLWASFGTLGFKNGSENRKTSLLPSNPMLRNRDLQYIDFFSVYSLYFDEKLCQMASMKLILKLSLLEIMNFNSIDIVTLASNPNAVSNFYRFKRNFNIIIGTLLICGPKKSSS